jgi:membrane protease YdiL (CAAX protease family)
VKQYLSAVVFCLVTGVFGLWRGRNRNYGWVIALTVASLVFGVFGWNAESQEVVRHTIDMWIYVTIAVILSVGAIADEVIRIHKSRVPEPAAYPPR